MNRITWIASYPKSGSTWVRFLIANLISGGVSSFDEVESLIPGHRRPKEITSDVRYRKTHRVYSSEDPDFSGPSKAVYICRNPLDVISSAINHRKLINPNIKNMSDSDITIFEQELILEFLEHGGLNAWSKVGFSNWKENVDSWLQPNESLEVCLIRFEDLLHSPVDTIVRLCDFLEILSTGPQIASAISASSFEALRELEESEIASGRTAAGGKLFSDTSVGQRSGYRFINKGQSGSYRKILTDEQVARAIEKFGQTMQDLGYSGLPPKSSQRV